MSKVWEAEFPLLGNWVCTSKRTREYNCFAWAAGDDTSRWDPMPGNYWPHRLPRNCNVDTIIRLYELKGYERCQDGSLDPYFEKIVLYVTGHGVQHAARQLPSGLWTSKLGDEEDITHESPASLSCEDYGQPVCYMRKAIQMGDAK